MLGWDALGELDLARDGGAGRRAGAMYPGGAPLTNAQEPVEVKGLTPHLARTREQALRTTAGAPGRRIA